jgi:phospholipid/cholesterol/gamma-HCH transport system substrate-binding protein
VRGRRREEQQDITASHAGPHPGLDFEPARRVRTSRAGRGAALVALALGVVLVVLIVTQNSGSYTLHARFQDAGGLVAGNQVFIGPTPVGTVSSIELSPDGGADVTLSLDSGAAPMHEGTVARVYENSLSGVTNKYVVLEPTSNVAPPMKSGGWIAPGNAYSQVSLDELFDTLNGPARNGLRGFIRGQAASIQGRAKEANRTLQYFAPALSSTAQVTGELAKDEASFDGLLVQGAKTFQGLATKTQSLTALIADTASTTGALASRATQLEQALQLAPGALNHSTRTFAGLRQTLDALDPFVAESKVASRRLKPFSESLLRFTQNSVPTIGLLAALIHNPTGGGDLTTLLRDTPKLAAAAVKDFPEIVRSMNYSEPQIEGLREYAPDIVAALSDVGQASANYDANGHYSRTQPFFGAFSVNSSNQLVPLADQGQRYAGLSLAPNRCPGGAVQPSPDGTAPWRVPGCSLTSTPPGP